MGKLHSKHRKKSGRRTTQRNVTRSAVDLTTDPDTLLRSTDTQPRSAVVFTADPGPLQKTTFSRTRRKLDENELRQKHLSEPNLHVQPPETDDDIKDNIIDRNVKATAQRLFIGAIDIGTTYSGWAFSARQDVAKDASNIYCPQWPADGGVYYKTATAVLFKQDKTFFKFGFEAETYYHDKDEQDLSQWYFFRNFKMLLYEKKRILSKDITLRDMNGKEDMKAVEVFSAAINYLKEDALSRIRNSFDSRSKFSNDDIHWVITVPAIWDMKAKQFMRDAANLAGISNDQLSLALEPEAASLYCRSVPMSIKNDSRRKTIDILEEGTSYIILDQGGGTIDVTAHQIGPDNSLKELYPANGGDWGGDFVNREFELYLEKTFTTQVVDTIKRDHPFEYLEVLKSFERKKREFDPESDFYSSNVVLKVNPVFEKTYKSLIQPDLPNDINIKFGNMRIPTNDFRSFYDKSVKFIVTHISSLMTKPELKDIRKLLAVGGFSESKVLMESIKEQFPNLKITVPKDSNLAVLKGAVLFGLEPSSVKSRKSRYTYGIAVEKEIPDECIDMYQKMRRKDGKRYAVDVFQKLVEIGEEVAVDKWQPPTEYDLVDSRLQEVNIEFFATEKTNPVHVTDEDCIKLGTLKVDLRERKTSNGALSLKIKAGGTEIFAELTDKNTGKNFKAHFCLP